MSGYQKFSAIFPSVCLLAATVSLAAQTAPSFELKRDTIASSGSALAQGDFNQDGKPDLILGGGAQPNNISLRAGNGDGTFQAPRAIGTVAGYSTLEIVAADVNHDGRLDVVALDMSGMVNVFYGKGDGTFTASTPFAAVNAANTIAVADFNGDGLLDVAVGDQAGGVEVFSNVGGTHFAYAQSIQLPSTSGLGILKLRAGDIDGAGISSLAAVMSNSAWALWGDGRGNFSPSLLADYDAAASLNFGDLKQNGKSQILVSYHCAGSNPYPSRVPYVPCMGVDAFTSSGNHTVTQKTILHDGTVDARRPWVADVNGDGIADLVSATRNNQDTQEGIFVWLGKADGTYQQTALPYIVTSDGGNDMVMGDWNRDGMIDFAEPVGTESELETYLNGGARSACAAATASAGISLCAPVDHTYAPATFNVSAAAYAPAGVIAIQQYLDGNLYAAQPGTAFFAPMTLPLGTHTIAAKSWDRTGASYLTVHTVTTLSGTPGTTCAATLGAANLCVPATAASGQIHIVGNAWTPAVPTAAQLYIDGKLVINDQACTAYCPGGSSSVDTWQTLTAGTHALTFKLWDATGGVYSSSKTVAVH